MIGKNDEKVIGFKEGDSVPPNKIFGAGVEAEDVTIAKLPDGIRFFIRGIPVDMPGVERVEFLLYELMVGPQKMKRRFIEKVIDRIPDDNYIKEKWGPNEHGYQWQAKWLDGSEEKNVLSPFIYISDRLPLSASVAAAPAAAAAQGFGFKELMEMQAAAEERAFRNVERMAAVFKSAQGPGAEGVMAKGVEAVERMMVSLVDSQLGVVKKVGKMTQDRIEEDLARLAPGDDEDDEEGDGEAEPEAPRSSGMPGWLEMIWPHVENGIKHLTGGGPTAAVAKSMILGTEEFKTVFNDVEKFKVFEEAARAQFGDEQVEKALKILLNKRDEKKSGKTAKK